MHFREKSITLDRKNERYAKKELDELTGMWYTIP